MGRILLLIGTGSFIGGICRYLISKFIQSKFISPFPFATLGVNLIGCFFIGILWGLSERYVFTEEWRLFFATGLLGGFTTFSAFSYDSVTLLTNGQVWQALAYIASSVILGVAATLAGVLIMKAIV